MLYIYIYIWEKKWPLLYCRCSKRGILLFEDKSTCVKWTLVCTKRMRLYFVISSYRCVVKRKKKMVQCAFIFQFFWQGRTIINYEQMQSLFAFSKMLNYPTKHWVDSVGWKSWACHVFCLCWNLSMIWQSLCKLGMFSCVITF